MSILPNIDLLIECSCLPNLLRLPVRWLELIYFVAKLLSLTKVNLSNVIIVVLLFLSANRCQSLHYLV